MLPEINAVVVNGMGGAAVVIRSNGVVITGSVTKEPVVISRECSCLVKANIKAF